MKTRRNQQVGSLVWGAMAAATVQAQQTLPAELEEVVVTAGRREEALTSVATSVAVASGDILEQLNLNAAEDLSRLAPSLTIVGYGTPRGAGFKIRGVGTAIFADGIEQSVGTVVDGIPLARAGQGLADLIDVERVEVLRGPQGLLFGRNASAGLVNVVTRRPSAEPSLAADVSYGSANQLKASASVAGPFTDALRGRLTGYTTQEDGLVHNIGTGKDYNSRSEHGFRGQLLFEPSGDLEFVLRGDWSKRDNECCIWTVNRFATPETDPRPTAVFLSSITGPIEEGVGAREVNPRGEIFNKVENDGASLEVNYRLGTYTLTSLTGYRSWSQEDNNDADISPYNVGDRNYGGNDLTQFSQEFRLTSPKDRFVDFVAGLFYYDTENEGNFQQVGRLTSGFAQAQAPGIDIPLAPGVVLPAEQNFGRDVNTVIKVTDYAAFGQANVNFTPSTRLIIGGRLTNTEVSMYYSRVGTPGSSAYNFILGPAWLPLAFKASQSDTDFSWRLGVAHDFGEDGNLYATITRGYKGPGYNNLLDVVVPAGTTPQDFTEVRAERPTNYEVGYKANLLDRRVRVGLAAYYTEFEDFQAQVLEPQSIGVSLFAIRNAGRLITQGFEADVEALVTPDLTVGAAVAYGDSYFDEFKDAGCPAAGAFVNEVGAPCGPTAPGGPRAVSFDASGLDNVGAPRWTANLNAHYQHTLGQSEWLGYAQGLYNWRSDNTFILYPDNISNPTRFGAYGLLNLTAGISNDRLGTSISLFVNNVFDKQFPLSLSALPFDAIGGVGQIVNRDAERMYGIKVSVRR